MSYVLKLCGWYPSENDAFSGDFVQRHALSIATQIPVVVIYATKLTKSAGTKLRIEKKINGNLTEYIAYYPGSGMLGRLWSQYWYRLIFKKIAGELLLQRGTPDVIHINIVWKPAMWYKMARRRFHCPAVVTENSTEYQSEARFHFRNHNPWRKKLMRDVFQSSQAWIPVSKQLGKVLSGLFGEKPVIVVPNAVDTTRFFLLERKLTDNFRLIHISTLAHQKNPEGFFRVMDRILAENKNALLTVIGPKPAEWILWQQEKEYRQQQIEFTGWLPYDEVARQMQKSDLLVLFSRYENLPCVILEAFCCGVPVVATRVGGIEEVVKANNGVLVDSEDEKAFYEAVLGAMENHSLYNREQIAIEAANKFNYTTIGQQFVHAYREVGVKF